MFRHHKPRARGRPKKKNRLVFKKIGVYDDTHRRAKINAKRNKVTMANYIDYLVKDDEY